MNWIVFALLSAFFAALVAILGKIGLQKIDTTLATTLRAVVMAGFFLVVSFAFGKFKLQGVEENAFLYIFFSGIAGALSWLFYFFALKIGPASAVSALDRLSVVFVVILSVLILGDKLSWQTVTGSLLIISGAILMVIK